MTPGGMFFSAPGTPQAYHMPFPPTMMQPPTPTQSKQPPALISTASMPKLKEHMPKHALYNNYDGDDDDDDKKKKKKKNAVKRAKRSGTLEHTAKEKIRRADIVHSCDLFRGIVPGTQVCICGSGGGVME